MEQYYTPRNDRELRPAVDGFAFFSLFISIVSVFFSVSVFGGVIGGIFAIATGIISRVRTERFCLNSILGIVIGAIAILLSCVVFLGMLIMLQNPETLAQILEVYSQQMQ